MTGSNDVFSQLDAAEPVTDDESDSVATSVDQSEADKLRSDAHTTDDTPTSSRRRRPPTSQYVAQCRFCRLKFERTGTAVAHEGQCKAEPVSQCRYCTDTHSPTETPEAHLKSCDAYRRAAQQQAEDKHTEADATDDTSDETGEGDEEHFSRHFIKPQPHEFHAYLKWDCSNLDNPLRSYFGFVSLRKEHKFKKYGPLETTTEIEGKEWNVEFDFKKKAE